MYVCICKAITDKQIEEATKSSGNFNEACKKLGLGSECGVCLQDAINNYHQKNGKYKNPKKTATPADHKS